MAATLPNPFSPAELTALLERQTGQTGTLTITGNPDVGPCQVSSTTWTDATIDTWYQRLPWTPRQPGQPAPDPMDAYVQIGKNATNTPANAAGGGPGIAGAVVGVDVPMVVSAQGVAYDTSGSPTVIDGGGPLYTLNAAYVAIPFTIPQGQDYVGSILLAITTPTTTPDANTYLTAGIWTDNGGAPGANLTQQGNTAVPSLYADQLSNPENLGTPMPVTNGSLATPYFIRTYGIAPGPYWLVLQTHGVTGTFQLATTTGGINAVALKTSADGAAWAAGTTESLALGLFNASQPGGMFHANGYVGMRGDSGSSYGGTMEGAGGYYGVYGTGGGAGVYGHSHGNYGVQGNSVHGPGVFGSTDSLAANNPGVYGTGPTGVQGDSGNAGYQGVLGNGSAGAAGVAGISSGSGIGVHGKSTAAAGAGSAVKGEVTASTAYAVEARSYSGTAGFFRKTDGTGSAASTVIAQGDTSLQATGGYLYEAQDDAGATLGGIWSDGSLKLEGANAVIAFRSTALVAAATAGTAALPANPAGFVVVYVGTTPYKVPLYPN